MYGIVHYIHEILSHNIQTQTLNYSIGTVLQNTYSIALCAKGCDWCLYIDYQTYFTVLIVIARWDGHILQS